MKAKEFLKQVLKLDRLIENKLIEREQWKSIAMGTTSGGAEVMVNGVAHKMDRVQSSGNPQKMADAVARYVDLKKEIDAVVDELIATKKDVIAVIEQLNPIEYDLLHKMYIQHIPLDEVADGLFTCARYQPFCATRIRPHLPRPRLPSALRL